VQRSCATIARVTSNRDLKITICGVLFRVRDPAAELEELFCRQTPGPRAHHSMVVFQEKLYLLGGKKADRVFRADTWYRGTLVL
jgi:hypothetical protein